MDKTESVFPGPLPPLCEGQFFAWKFLLGYLTLCEKLVGGIFVEHEIHFREPIARPVHLTALDISMFSIEFNLKTNFFLYRLFSSPVVST